MTVRATAPVEPRKLASTFQAAKRPSVAAKSAAAVPAGGATDDGKPQEQVGAWLTTFWHTRADWDT